MSSGESRFPASRSGSVHPALRVAAKVLATVGAVTALCSTASVAQQSSQARIQVSVTVIPAATHATQTLIRDEMVRLSVLPESPKTGHASDHAVDVARPRGADRPTNGFQPPSDRLAVIRVENAGPGTPARIVAEYAAN